MGDVDGRLARWCDEHDGIVGVDDRRKLGIAESTFLDQVPAGVLVRVHPGVYRHAAHPPTVAARLRAALVAAGDVSFASGPSLMRLYGIRSDWPERPEIVVVGHRHLVLEGVRVRRIDRLDPRDVRSRGGFPALAPPLGLLLLGATTHPAKVVTAGHDMVFLGFTTRPHLFDVRNRYRACGRRGAVSLDRAVLSLDADGKATQTNFELHVLMDLRKHPIPEPALQFPVIDGDGRRRRLDIAWPDLRLDVETDGDRFHLDAIARKEMKRRDAAMARIGWAVERIASLEWELDPGECIQRVLDALAEQAAKLLAPPA